MTAILPLVLIAGLLSPLNLFAEKLKVSRLVILTDRLTPELSKAIFINEYYLSKKGIICKAYTNKQIETCLKTYSASEIWYVYLGHSNGNDIGDFLTLKTITFPQLP